MILIMRGIALQVVGIHNMTIPKRQGIIIGGYNDLKSHCARHGHPETIDTGYIGLVKKGYNYIKYVPVKYCACEYDKICMVNYLYQQADLANNTYFSF